MHTCVKEKKKLHQFSYSDFIFEVTNIDFWQIWVFDTKGAGGWICNFSSF